MDDAAAALEKIRRHFAGDRFALECGAVITGVDERGAVCRMDLTARHRNALGIVMGGAIFTLADFAFAVAANWQGVPTVSVDADIRFLTVARGDRLTAAARCLRDGRSACCYQVEVRDAEERLISLVTITGAHVTADPAARPARENC